MYNMECRICKIQSQINSAERSLRLIKIESDRLMRLIPGDYKNKNNMNLNNYKQSFNGFCGCKCYKNYDNDFSFNEDRVFNNLKIIFSYNKDNPNTLNLNALKYNCRGDYSKLYRLIETL